MHKNNEIDAKHDILQPLPLRIGRAIESAVGKHSGIPGRKYRGSC